MSTDAVARIPVRRRRRMTVPRFLCEARGLAGAIGVAVICLIAFVGPAFAPYNPDATVSFPYASPGSLPPFGADFIGRDVLSRALAGGHTVILLSVAATALAYLIGLTVGLIAGYSRSWPDNVLMRSADVLIAFPPIVFLLVVVTGAGHNLVALVVALGVIESPGLARIIRSAVTEVSSRSYVEAAVVRGDSQKTILLRDILPNISHVVAADVGLRLTYSVILLASISFLGLGVQAPQSDWARMVSENREALAFQPWATLVPVLLLGIFLVSVNLLSDAVARNLGVSVEALEAEGTAR